MDIKKFRWVVTILWGFLFLINMVCWLYTRSQLSLFVAGAMLGGFFIQLTETPHMNWLSTFSDDTMKRWGNSVKQQENLMRRVYDLEDKLKKKEKKWGNRR